MTEREREREKRIQKAKNLRYKKPIVSGLTWDEITERVWQMQSDLSDVRWMTEDEEELINALDGDEDAAFEFKLAYSDLQYDCERMADEMEQLRGLECEFGELGGEGTLFDLVFPAAEGAGEYMGYDTYERDYFPLMSSETEYAQKIAQEQLQRLTKRQLIELMTLAFAIYQRYMGLIYRYDCIEAALGILKGTNEETLKIVKRIEQLYDEAEMATDGFKREWNSWRQRREIRDCKEVRELDKAIGELPERLWLE